MSSDRTAEIWSTRLQRELLALSESSQQQEEEKEANDTAETTEEETKPKKKSKNADIALLPPFIRLKSHVLDIEEGICKVSFDVDVCPKKKDETEDETKETKEGETKEIAPIVSITLDVSLQRNNQNEPVANPNTYPFQKPKAILKSGQELFPSKSDICNGDYIDIDCDWTPSLHLSDAALNVSLKIRECIRKDYAFVKAEMHVNDDDNLLDEEGNGLLSRIMGNISSVAAAASSSIQSGLNEELSSETRQQQHLGIIHIGDEVKLNEEPFSLCVGMYPVKTLRRPEFMQAEIKQAEIRRQQLANAALEEEEDENEIPSGWGNYMGLQAGGIKKVAGAGFSGAGSMFKSAWRSTTKALEESYLMITDDFILELRATKFTSASTATVTYIIPISLLAKLKFRRHESLSLFFKQAQDDPYILMCTDSYDAVQQIQTMLQRYGVKGKHTNSTTQRLIQEAMTIIYQVQQKEKALEDAPSKEAVEDIMSLYRQAAELFENANDPRHEEIMEHMREFLAKPFVSALLDSDKQNTSTETTDETQRKETDILKDMLKDTDDIFDDNDDLNVDDLLNSNGVTADDDGDMEDIDAMLSAADKELDEIMKS